MDEVMQLVNDYVAHNIKLWLHSAIGYITLRDSGQARVDASYARHQDKLNPVQAQRQQILAQRARQTEYELNNFGSKKSGNLYCAEYTLFL